MPFEVYLNVAASGLLTGLVYGLMALGLSVIFGVVRVVNFAHGEMMTLAMYLTLVLFGALKLDPLLLLVPVAAVLFAFGYLLQLSVINPFINRPEHEQRGGDRHQQQERIELQRAEQHQRQVHGQRHHLAMREVDDAHHAEDDRQAERHQPVDETRQQAAGGDV